MTDKHLILMGFKHVGKTTVGKMLAKRLQRPFIDLDQSIKTIYRHEYQRAWSCREIFNHHGEVFFRAYETEQLKQILAHPPAVIALGGGAPLQAENQPLLTSQVLIFLTAAPKAVYQRIISKGTPAFFPADADPWEFFQRLWIARELVYSKLADFSVDNTGTTQTTIAQILQKLESQP